MSEKLLDEKELQEAIRYEIISPAFAERVRQLIKAYAASQLTPVAADFEACPADHAKLQAMRLAPKFCPACGVRLQSR